MYKGKYEQKPDGGAPKAARVAVSQEKPPVTEEQPETRRTAQRKPTKKGTTKGTYIFYGIYLAFVLIFFIGVAIGMGMLKEWLVNFQAAQPETKSMQVFQQLFADPDWSSIYSIANPDNTDAEVQAAYVEYMDELIGDDELTFIETSAGLSGDKKYIVCHGNVGIAIFTLTADNKSAQVPDWKLGTVQVFFQYNRCLSYNFVVLPGCTITVNGTVLDESHLIRTVSTKAEDYLPDGIHGYRLQEYRITDLKKEPEVAVQDANGQAVEMHYDEATQTYTQVMPEAPTIAQDEYDAVLGAAKAYTEFMIKGTYGLTKYFNTNSEIYKTITGGMIIRQSYSSYKFEKEVISDYYKYSDTLFSAKINLVTKVTRKDGTIKEFEVNSTFIYEKSNGKWVVRDMVNVDIQEKITTVRLTFKDAEGKLLSSELVNANIKMLTLPSITPPDGQVFAGWYEQTFDVEGNEKLDFQFMPNDSGSVNLGSGNPLRPMVLVPQFKEAE